MAMLLVSCKRYEPTAVDAAITTAEPSTFDLDSLQPTTEETTVETTEAETEPEWVDTRTPVKVKGLYLASKRVGNYEFMKEIMDVCDKTEINAIVIDIKDDYGKVTYDMKNVQSVIDLQTIEVSIENLPELLDELKSHGIYCIARIVTMRDPHLARVKPEWMLTKQDGTVYKDNSGYAWVNPYKTEYWDYVLDIALEAGRIGFQEVQFDYIRFCTDKGAGDCIFDEEEVQSRDKIAIISECVQYLSENLRKAGIYMSADVFGTIIASKVDSRSVGQDYAQIAATVDYICPMIYPSHYAAGNFSLDYPDLHPYEAILGACKRSKYALKNVEEEYGHNAQVRPWLQAFTATWLGSGKYRTYDREAIRQEIKGVYDAGYDEWILWNPSVKYDYSGFLSKAEGQAEEKRIEESRALIPTEEQTEPEETFPVELAEALNGDELYKEDESKLLEDGPIIVYE
ncbi:MAG: putative glycoside hydrolase [Eubacteriales bacterium]|nr:putative glycoside hydrolase [Eubacteriales bacterium]